MVWNTPNGTRKLVGAERTVYIDCVESLLDTAFSSARARASPEELAGARLTRSKAKEDDTPAYAHDSVGLFYTLGSVDALLVLKAVCEALLTDAPEPELTSLYEAAAFAPIKHRVATFVPSAENRVVLALQACRVVRQARALEAKNDGKNKGKADKTGDEGDKDEDEKEDEEGDEEGDEMRAIFAGDIQSFFFERFTDGIFWDTDFENEEIFARLDSAKRARMMTSIGPDYKEQGARQVRALRDEHRASTPSALSSDEQRVALVAAIRAVCASS